MSAVVKFPVQPLAAIIVRRATAGPHPFVCVPRTRTVPGKPSTAIGQAYGARTLDDAMLCARGIAERTGLPIVVDPAAEGYCHDGNGLPDSPGPGMAA